MYKNVSSIPHLSKNIIYTPKFGNIFAMIGNFSTNIKFSIRNSVWD